MSQKKKKQKQVTTTTVVEEKQYLFSSFITFSVACFFVGLVALTIEDAISEKWGGFSPGFSLYFFVPIVILIYNAYMKQTKRCEESFFRKVIDKLIWLLVGYLNMVGVSFMLEHGYWLVKQGEQGFMNGSEYSIFFVVGAIATLPVFAIIDIVYFFKKGIYG